MLIVYLLLNKVKKCNYMAEYSKDCKEMQLKTKFCKKVKKSIFHCLSTGKKIQEQKK